VRSTAADKTIQASTQLELSVNRHAPLHVRCGVLALASGTLGAAPERLRHATASASLVDVCDAGALALLRCEVPFTRVCPLRWLRRRHGCATMGTGSARTWP